MNDGRTFIFAIVGLALLIFFFQFMAMVVAPGLITAYVYIAGMKRTFDLKNGSPAMIFHVLVGLALAVTLIWFFFISTGLYQKYFN